MEKSLWRLSSGLPQKDSQRERWIFCQLSLRESFWISQEDNLSRLSPLIPQEKAPSQRGTLCPRLSKEILPCFFQKGDLFESPLRASSDRLIEGEMDFLPVLPRESAWINQERSLERSP